MKREEDELDRASKGAATVLMIVAVMCVLAYWIWTGWQHL